MGSTKKSVFKSALDFEIRQLAITLEIIDRQKALLAIVISALPIEIAGHVRHCVLSGACMLIYTESANWASQIRFFHRDILNKFKGYGQLKIDNMQVRITPQLNLPSGKRCAQLPAIENIERLRNLAENYENDDELKQAMMKLARTLDKRQKAKI